MTRTRTVLRRRSIRMAVVAAVLGVIVMAAGGGVARAGVVPPTLCPNGIIVMGTPCPGFVYLDYRDTYGWPYGGGSPVPDPGPPSFQVGSTGSYEFEAVEQPGNAPDPVKGPPFAAGQISFTHSGTLPSGVTFTDNGDGTATMAWTPAVTTPGSYPFTVTVNSTTEAPCVSGGVDLCSTYTESLTLTVDPAEAPEVTNYTTPNAITGSPFDVSFDRPVKGVNTSDFTIVEVGYSSGLAGTVNCLDSSQNSVDCTTGPVTTAQFSPSAALWAGEEYFVNINPSSSGVVGYSDNQPVAPTQGYVRVATTVQADQSPPLTYKWGVVQNPSAIGGSYQMAQNNGAIIQFAFNGSRLALTFWDSPQGGEALVHIANDPEQVIDTYSATPGDVTTTFRHLGGGPHEALIFVTGANQAPSAGTQIGLDSASTATKVISKFSETWADAPPRYAGEKGASVSLSYRGNGVTWYAVAGPFMGKATATIDGIKVGTFNLYAPNLVLKSYTLSYAGIGDTGHILKITATGTKSAQSTNTLVTLNHLVLN